MAPWPLTQGRRKASELWNKKLAKAAIATVSEQGRKHVEPGRLFCQAGSGMRSEDLPVGQHKAWEKWLDSREFSKYSAEETLMYRIWVVLTGKKKGNPAWFQGSWPKPLNEWSCHLLRWGHLRGETLSQDRISIWLWPCYISNVY